MNILVTLDVIREQLAAAKNPAVLCSFGKDSLVLTHLIRTYLQDIPVIFYKEPTMPKKYRYARQVIEEWNLNVHEFLPIKVGMQQIDDVVEFVNYYQLGAGLLSLALNRTEPNENETCLCGIIDFLMKPVANSTFPWDVVFHGQKSCDTDPSYKSLKLKHQVVKHEGSATVVFPLKEWSDEDVWEYIETNQLPIHHERYEKLDGKWQQKRDTTFNPDTFPLCAKCLLSKYPTQCPKFKKEVPGMADKIELVKPFIPTYVEN